MYTGGEPERPLGRYFPRFAGDQELFIAVCVCVCVVRDHSESQSFLFSRNRRRPRWPHWLLEIHRKHEPAYAPTTSVLASRGRCFSCPRVARCTAKINSLCLGITSVCVAWVGSVLLKCELVYRIICFLGRLSLER